MKQRKKQSASPSPRNPATLRVVSGAPTEGYALMIVMMLVTVLLVSLTASLPSVYTAGQREKEEELLFRGNEYARAILLFRRQFRRYPTSVKELLQTNGIRFLRREYSDPMSRSGKWRFVHADASGTPLDSRTFARPKPVSALGTSQPAPEEKQDTDTPRGKPGRFQADEDTQPKETSAFFGDNKGMQGAFLIGVASSSRRDSIRVWNNKTRYSDWEFLGVEMGTGGAIPGGQIGQPAGPGQQPRSNFGPSGQGTRGLSPMEIPPLTDQPISQQ